MDYAGLKRRVQALYRQEPRWTRFKVWGRLRSLDYRPVLAALPAEGTLFDFGCGHGFFAALAHFHRPRLRVMGCDISAEKLAVAGRCLPRVLPLELSHGSRMPEQGASVDALSMLDVLHYVPFERWDELLRGAFGALRSGGVFLLKEHDPGMRLKFLLNSVFETMTTGWNEVAKRSDLTFRPRRWFLDRLAAVGFAVDVTRLDRWTPFSHVLYVARKP